MKKNPEGQRVGQTNPQTGRDQKTANASTTVFKPKEMRIVIPRDPTLDGLAGLKKSKATTTYDYKRQECLCAAFMISLLVACLPAIVFLVLSLVNIL